MSDLAHYMNVTTAAMTGMIDRLVRDGYLKRHDDPSDRRIIRVYLTKKGKNTVKDTIEHKRKMTINLFGKISQAERENYLSILMHIRDHLKCA
jgi:DNA-binding MarR family transcriptional regulator